MTSYSIKKPNNEKVFIITLQLAVCLEKDGSCMFEKKLLDGTKVPQVGCDMSFNFSSNYDLSYCTKDYSLRI